MAPLRRAPANRSASAACLGTTAAIRPGGNPGATRAATAAAGRPDKGPDRGPVGRRRRRPAAAAGPGMPDLDELIARLQDAGAPLRAGRPGGRRRAARQRPAARRCSALVAVAIWLGQRLLPRAAGRAGRRAALRRLPRHTYPGLNYHIPGRSRGADPGGHPHQPHRGRLPQPAGPSRSAAAPRDRRRQPRGAGRSADADRRREHHRHQLLRVLAHPGRRRLPVQHPQPRRDRQAPPRRA